MMPLIQRTLIVYRRYLDYNGRPDTLVIIKLMDAEKDALRYLAQGLDIQVPCYPRDVELDALGIKHLPCDVSRRSGPKRPLSYFSSDFARGIFHGVADSSVATYERGTCLSADTVDVDFKATRYTKTDPDGVKSEHWGIRCVITPWLGSDNFPF